MSDLVEDMKQNKIVVKTDLVIILREIITDKRVSATAVRIYCYLSSKVGCWNFYNSELKEVLNIKSDHSISKYLRELIDCGYLCRNEIRNNGAFAGYQYVLSTVCQKMTIGDETKNDLNFQQNSRMSKNDNRCVKEEKEKNIKEKEELFNINNININKNNILVKEKNIKKEKLQNDLPKKAAAFEIKNEVDKEFFRYLQYRKDIKKAYKSEQSLSVVYKRFVKWCDGDADVARQIVDNTIANGWTGLFELKNSRRTERYVVNSNSSAYDVGVKA